MKRNHMRKIIGLAIIMALLLPVISSCSAPAKAEKVSAQTLSGYIMDTHCYLKKPDPGLDSKKCLQMPSCAATGFGIAVKQSDNTYKFYVFDGAFAPEATDAQQLAMNLINDTLKTDHIYITVAGTLTGKTVKAKEGAEFEIIEVASIQESEDPDL